mgnify:CR=1 FL=1
MHSRLQNSNNSAEAEFGVPLLPQKRKVKKTRKSIIRWRVLSDKIRDEQWSTLKIKALWKKNAKFKKWWEINIDTKPSDHRYYPSKFRGVYGSKD